MYSTVVSGLEKFRKAGVRVGFLTLTSYVGFDRQKYNYAFTKLRRLFVRYFRHRFSDCERLQRLEFFRLRTEEGKYGNVYHILIEMPHRIPVRCISHAWRALTGAYIVHIKWCYNWSSRISGVYVDIERFDKPRWFTPLEKRKKRV